MYQEAKVTSRQHETNDKTYEARYRYRGNAVGLVIRRDQAEGLSLKTLPCWYTENSVTVIQSSYSSYSDSAHVKTIHLNQGLVERLVDGDRSCGVVNVAACPGARLTVGLIPGVE